MAAFEQEVSKRTRILSKKFFKNDFSQFGNIQTMEKSSWNKTDFPDLDEQVIQSTWSS